MEVIFRKYHELYGEPIQEYTKIETLREIIKSTGSELDSDDLKKPRSGMSTKFTAKFRNISAHGSGGGKNITSESADHLYNDIILTSSNNVIDLRDAKYQNYEKADIESVLHLSESINKFIDKTNLYYHKSGNEMGKKLLHH